MFYELYIEDYNGDLIDVPVVIRNFKAANAERPNELGSDESSFRLTRRFFIFDTVSGIEGSYEDKDTARVVRYPFSITLRVKLDPDFEEMIHPPLLIIEYRERGSTVINELPLSSPSFTVEYAMNTDNFWKIARSLFITMNVIFGLILVLKLIVWC